MTSERTWHPEIVSWNTTQRCNLRCGHCYLAAGRAASGELTLDEGRRLIDELAGLGTQMLILSGGEPLLRPDLDELVEHTAARGLLPVLGTNGLLLTRTRARRLKELGLAGAAISLDSIDPEKHDRFRGARGAWRRAVRGIRACVAEDVPVIVQTTALSWNYGEVEALIRFAEAESAAGFTLYFLVCTGRAETLSDISPAQYERALGALTDAQARHPRLMIRARCAPQIARIASRRGSALVASAGCLAGRQYCRITADGKVTPCPYLPLEAGSIRERPFKEIWQHAPILSRLRDETPTGRCGTCEFRELCGGCRARSFALSGDLSGEDPWCAYRPLGRAAEVGDPRLRWTREADERVERIPPFVRDRVRLAVEQAARRGGLTEITVDELTATLASVGRRLPFRRPSARTPAPAHLDFDAHPRLVFWEATRACTLSCRHCRAAAIPSPLPGELGHDEARSLLEAVASFGEPRPITIFTGGDPLQRPDLPELVGHASALGLRIAVAPAVTPSLTAEALTALRERGVTTVSISLDGGSAETHERVRQAEGHFQATLDALRLARSCGLNVQVNTLVMRETAHELADVARLVKEHEASVWELFFLVRVGRGRNLVDLTPDESEDVCHFLFDASSYGLVVRTVEAPFFRRVVAWRSKDESGADPRSTYGLGPLYDVLAARLREQLGEASSEPRAQTGGTRDGKGVVFVAHNGDVFPAGFLPLPLGNVRVKSIVDIYRSHPLLRDIRAARFHGRCGECEYADLCGGSRARAFAASGDALGEDPACAYAPGSMDRSLSRPQYSSLRSRAGSA